MSRTGRHGHSLDGEQHAQAVLPPAPRLRPAPPAPRRLVVEQRRGPISVSRRRFYSFVVVLVLVALGARQWSALVLPAVLLWGAYRGRF